MLLLLLLWLMLLFEDDEDDVLSLFAAFVVVVVALCPSEWPFNKTQPLWFILLHRFTPKAHYYRHTLPARPLAADAQSNILVRFLGDLSIFHTVFLVIFGLFEGGGVGSDTNGDLCVWRRDVRLRDFKYFDYDREPVKNESLRTSFRSLGERRRTNTTRQNPSPFQSVTKRVSDSFRRRFGILSSRGFTSFVKFLPGKSNCVFVCMLFTYFCLCGVFLTSHMESSSAWIQKQNHSTTDDETRLRAYRRFMYFAFLWNIFENTHIWRPSKTFFETSLIPSR